jgi:hypothetical protein
MNQNGFALITGASGGLGMLLVLVAMVVCGGKSDGPRPEASDVFPPRPNEVRDIMSHERERQMAERVCSCCTTAYDQIDVAGSRG